VTAFDVRLAWRLHRFESVGFGILIALAAGAALFVAGELDATGYGARCLGATAPDGCEALGRAFFGIQQVQVPLVRAILTFVPFLLGALVGGPLVARELERGTSRLAWSIAPSRVRWFATRLVPAAAVVFAFALLAGVALDRLLAAVEPGSNVSASFSGFGMRGVVLAARATFVFAIGVPVGAVLGRVLPALLVTAVVAWIGITGGTYVHARILASEAVLVSSETVGPDDLYVAQRIRLPDGRVVTWEELDALIPPPVDGAGPTSSDAPPPVEEWPPAGSTFLDYVVPGDRYPFAAAREVGALGGASLAFVLFGAVVVVHRRPI
jgi:hypothetical protein